MISKAQQGFTLIELIIFIVVISVGMAGILLVMNTVVKGSVDPMVRKQSIAIAESLLEEILAKEYANPVDGYTGGQRSKFDDVGDYAGYSTSSGVTDLFGAPVAGLASYNIAPPVTVQPTTDLPGVAAKRVTVSVTGSGEVITISGYRTGY